MKTFRFKIAKQSGLVAWINVNEITIGLAIREARKKASQLGYMLIL